MILANDRCLFNGITVEEVSIPHPKPSMQELLRIETLEHPSNAEQLSVLIDRGTFRRLSSSENPADRFLVYTPKTLPYNSSAPLRNTVPYIPLRFSPSGVDIDPVIPPEFVNPSVRKFVSTFNQKLSPSQQAELRAEQQLIREQLGLDHIQSELNHIGSVVEDDCLSLSSDAEEMMQAFSQEFDIAVPPGLPPRSLKEIHQLPHKGKNYREEEEEARETRHGGAQSEDSTFSICQLLQTEPTMGLSDAEFMQQIGWSDEAASQAEQASKEILFPYIKWSVCEQTDEFLHSSMIWSSRKKTKKDDKARRDRRVGSTDQLTSCRLHSFTMKR